MAVHTDLFKILFHFFLRYFQMQIFIQIYTIPSKIPHDFHNY